MGEIPGFDGKLALCRLVAGCHYKRCPLDLPGSGRRRQQPGYPGKRRKNRLQSHPDLGDQVLR
jgi:hypothetical protein